MRLKKWIGILGGGLVSLVHAQSGFPTWNISSSDYAPFWIDSSCDVIQAQNKQLLKPFFTKLQTANKKKVTILHIGDSHVQADIFTGKIRDLMGQTFGRGGRGFVFPYTTAKTHTAIDYRCVHSGRWLYAKNVEKEPELPLGIMGITSRTYDKHAQFRLVFNKESIANDYRKLRIFCNRSSKSFDLKITTKSDTQKIDIFQLPGDSLSDEIVVTLRNAETVFNFEFLQRDTSQDFFEIYGISIESDQEKGVLYHSVGINGAGHFAIMRENLLADHLTYIKPDAIILDVGANDFYTKGLDIEQFKNNLISIIEHFKEHAPKCLIILSNSQDIFRGAYHLPECASFSKITAEIAIQQQIAFIDWFRISGGYKSMSWWKSHGLANRDGVHLTKEGYDLKGRLFYHAFKNSYSRVLNKKDTSIGIIVPKRDSFDFIPIDTVRKITDISLYEWRYHVVEVGETVWSIAAKYQVSALQIKNWNHLRTFSLKKGKRIRVFVKRNVDETLPMRNTHTVEVNVNPPEVKENPRKRHQTTTSRKSHNVKRGETLFSISRKFGVDVDDLKRINRIHGNNIRIGQKLMIP